MTQGQEEIAEPREYAAYLLRLWREKSSQTAGWRASLQDPHSGERVSFSSVERLFDFLRRETGSRPELHESTAGSDKSGS